MQEVCPSSNKPSQQPCLEDIGRVTINRVKCPVLELQVGRVHLQDVRALGVDVYADGGPLYGPLLLSSGRVEAGQSILPVLYDLRLVGHGKSSV